MTESTNENRSIYRFRWVGYGLLIFALVDTIQLFIPPQFTNPAWEFQTMGGLVERVPVPLLGFALVFFGEHFDRIALEKIALKVLSWLCLVLAILFLLMIPLGILDTVRVDTATEVQVNNQVKVQLDRFKQVEDQLNKSGPEDLKNLATQLSNLGISVDGQNPEGLKKQILERINTQRPQIEEQAKTALSNQRLQLFKNSVKWNLGALIASTLFFILWRSTNWAR